MHPSVAPFAELTQLALVGNDLPTFRRQTVLCIARTLGVEYSALWELLPDGKAFVLRAGAGWNGAVEGTTVDGANAALFQTAVLGTSLQLVVDWRNAAQPSQPALLREHGVVASRCVVIGGPEHPAGVLSVDSTEVRTFSEGEIQFLQAVANLLALASERLTTANTIERQVRERTYEIERRRQVAQSLYEILTILNSNHTLDGLLGYIIAQACRLLGTSAGAIYRLHNTGGMLTVQANWGLHAEDTSADISHETGAAGKAVRTRAPVTISNTATDPERMPAPDAKSPILRFGSQLAVPLLVKAEVYGAIVLYDHQPRVFSEDEVRLATSLSDHAALAIENARLVATAQDKAVLEERQRLARDLHDSVTQALYGVTLHAQAARRLLETANVATADNSLRALQDTAQEALDEMRLLIFELRPPILDQAGLAAALQARLEAVEGRVNLQTKLIVDDLSGLPAPVEHALYRIAQEALNNALKHSNARCITVRLKQSTSHVVLEIGDDGVGFDPAGETGGLGLRGIRERVAHFNGHVDVISTPGGGTQLRVEIAV